MTTIHSDPNLVIRKYAPDDLEALLTVWEASFRLAHPFLTEEFVAEVRKAIPEVYLPNTETWVAVSGQQLIGFMSLMQSEVGALFVTPEHIGAGYGKALLNTAHDQHNDLTVEVFTRNTRAVEFYRRFGFKEVRRHMHEESGNELIRLALSEECEPGE